MHQLALLTETKPSVEPALITIEFDGGTSCNIPRLGYGIGYGSFAINGGTVERVNHGRPMSANVAEIMTAVVALDRVRHLHGPSHLLVRGDSQIALKWLRPTLVTKGNGKRSADFILACQEAATAVGRHISVKTQWRGREHSVTLFGH
jgi:ribonuclease HI